MNDSLLAALQKAKHYCAYQERCHSEVRDKLYSLGLHKNEVEQLLTQLIEENFLNEERFAIAYAGGHFRTKQWGREKIKYALKQKRVSDYCIRKALALISNTDYTKTFNTVADKKSATLKSEKNIFIKKKKIKDYLQQRGFELSLINDYLKEI
ncbi:regulatory protein RecX [Parafilimonas sp.]|uniref:regulatory protein RecX n=1 Tax=Parafilimonas sp. TaxID=1969739 RepID=UPI0039E2FFCC